MWPNDGTSNSTIILVIKCIFIQRFCGSYFFFFHSLNEKWMWLAKKTSDQRALNRYNSKWYPANDIHCNHVHSLKEMKWPFQSLAKTFDGTHTDLYVLKARSFLINWVNFEVIFSHDSTHKLAAFYESGYIKIEEHFMHTWWIL